MKTPSQLLQEHSSRITAKTEEAVLNMLPVDQKTLRIIGKVVEPKNLKRIAIAAIGGSALISIGTAIGHDRLYRLTVANEMKKQLEPLQKKLEALEAQNAALLEQNQKLMAQLERMEK